MRRELHLSRINWELIAICTIVVRPDWQVMVTRLPASARRLYCTARSALLRGTGQTKALDNVPSFPH